MVRNYWFGKDVANDKYRVFQNVESYDVDKLKEEFTTAKEINIGFKWNNQTNYIPWEFKMWSDKIIEYGFINEDLIINITVYGGKPELANYILSATHTFTPLKAKVNVIWN